MHTYRIVFNDQDLTGVEAIAYDHVGFDDAGHEIVEISTERDVSRQLDASPAVIRYEELN